MSKEAQALYLQKTLDATIHRCVALHDCVLIIYCYYLPKITINTYSMQVCKGMGGIRNMVLRLSSFKLSR